MNRDRPTAWRLAPPTEGQLALLARYGIDPPPNATRGEVSDMLDWCSELGSTWRPRCDCCVFCGAFTGECDCRDNNDGDDFSPDDNNEAP